MVDALFRGARDLLVENGGFRIRRFGALEVRQRRSRRGGDPRGGRVFVSAARRAPFFRPSRALLEGMATVRSVGKGANDASETPQKAAARR